VGHTGPHPCTVTFRLHACIHSPTFQRIYTRLVGDHGPGDDASNCAAMAKYNPPGLNPCMDSEYYTGWLSHWGEDMANTSSSSVAQYLDLIMSTGSSFNLYMGYGGYVRGQNSAAHVRSRLTRPISQPLPQYQFRLLGRGERWWSFLSAPHYFL